MPGGEGALRGRCRPDQQTPRLIVPPSCLRRENRPNSIGAGAAAD